ncbi:SAV_915 family protein [Leucobacter sp.]
MSQGVIVPPVLYLPVVEGQDAPGQEFVVRSLTDGRDGLLAYTALDRLVRACGEEQPWILLPIEELERVKQAQPFDVVAFDLDVPPTQRRGGRLA